MFSANHRQHLLVAFQHLDEALDEVLRRLGAPTETRLFARLRDDVDPAARERARIAVDAVRGEIRTFMLRHEMQPNPPGIGAAHAANARLALAMVNASELGPSHLRGYGALASAEAQELASLSERLRERLEAVISALPERSR
jgi:hypothetical protein